MRTPRVGGAVVVVMCTALAACSQAGDYWDVEAMWAEHSGTLGAITLGEVTDEAIQRGDDFFNRSDFHCSDCHGEAGVGGDNAPVLNDASWLHSTGSLEDIRRTLVTGVPRDRLTDDTRRWPMRPVRRVGDVLDPEALNDLTAYVWSLSHTNANRF